LFLLLKQPLPAVAVQLTVFNKFVSSWSWCCCLEC